MKLLLISPWANTIKDGDKGSLGRVAEVKSLTLTTCKENSAFDVLHKTVRLLIFAAIVVMTSCVSSKKYQVALDHNANYEKEIRNYEEELGNYKSTLLVCENDLGHANSKASLLESEMEYFKATNTDLLDRLADLSVVSQSGAESIKKSLEALNEQNRYIKDLTTSMRKKDSLNLVLVMNLRRSLADINDEDINIEVKKGVVYVSLSDKMLFKTGSSIIQPRAEEVLGKIATVVNDHQNLDILVEGHTDTVPIQTECMTDNWDLSVKRATSVVRTLQTEFGVKPERMTAGGRGEYIPKATNETDEGRSLNRRTEIIILPKLDEFFQLLTPPADNTVSAN